MLGVYTVFVTVSITNKNTLLSFTSIYSLLYIVNISSILYVLYAYGWFSHIDVHSMVRSLIHIGHIINVALLSAYILI